MSPLRIGTCSWKFPSWHGLVYSAPKGINYLAEYAQRYDSVEIDQWFWSLWGEDDVSLPDPGVVAEYRAAVPDDFRFTVKAPNSISLTHFYRKGKKGPLRPNPWFLSGPLFQRFLSLLSPLKDQLGPVMLQFEYLNRQKMANQGQFQMQLQTFAEEVAGACELAIEIRNGNYLNQAYFEFLHRRGLIPVLLQGYWMPPVTELYEKWGALIREHETVVIRLHGPDRKQMEELTGKQWDQIVAARDEELKGVVAMVQDLLSRGTRVYLNVNNHYEGSAPLTIQRIQQLL